MYGKAIGEAIIALMVVSFLVGAALPFVVHGIYIWALAPLQVYILAQGWADTTGSYLLAGGGVVLGSVLLVALLGALARPFRRDM